MELKGKIINFLGDSITEGEGASDPENTLPALVAKLSGAVCNNYGIGGTRIAPQHIRLPGMEMYDRDFVGRFDQMDKNADVTVVFGGTNDYFSGDAPFGGFDDRTADTFCGAVHVLFSGLINRYPDKTVVVMTPIQREFNQKPNDKGLILRDYVDVIRRTAAYYSLPLLDLYGAGGICVDIPGQFAALMHDGRHPNDAGYAVIASKLYHFLKRL